MDTNSSFKFDLQGELGRGGMSVVHRAYDPVLERYTALKVLQARNDQGKSRTRFVDEACITGQLEHPNIVPLYEFGTDPEGRDFMNMKLVQGQSFLHRIRALGPARLDPDHLAESLQILIKVCDAMAFAHSRGIVHRDLKPSNIMSGEFGEVYVMDWGIALRMGGIIAEPESFDERSVLGTPTFVAPEQIDEADQVDARADVYCMGGILYALLTGQAPHQGRTPMLRLMAAAHGRIAPPEEVNPDPRVPPSLARIAMRALRRQPEQRHPSMSAFKGDLQAFLHGAWHLPQRTVFAGTIVVEEGQPGDEAYIIRQGRCRVYSKAAGDIRELGPGEVFGELAVLSGGVRTSTVEALTDLELLVVQRDVLREGLGLNTWLGTFVQRLAYRFAELETRLAQR